MYAYNRSNKMCILFHCRHSLSDIDLKIHKNCIKMNNISLVNQVTFDVFPSLHLLYDFIDSNDAHNKALLKYPILPYSIIAFYVLLVTWIGPAIMKSHKPFNLQKVLIIYNFLQAVANSYIAYNIVVGVSEHWDSRCRMRSDPKLEILLEKAMKQGWHLYLIKFADLLDTVFFVLRKKQNQVSFLHVFHHAGMCLLYFWGLNNIYHTPGFYMAIGFGVNTMVHVIMYTYYCLAAFGPHMQKYLWWKRHLTRLQIGQIFFILSYMTVAFITGCEEFGKLEATALIYGFITLALFLNFYRKYKKAIK
ncbi:elongation of very long chain fatty acids protein 7 [Trichonephila clavata]|uniref:Elongation of very long chain fatty acids protein n=1 Tax=Trichonephila clavata TaxID=2740835 RepID=A0A8X6J383_TRICU|nr:elongation of very long chain fatty acids protein 7 [Trichonephila clavata]